MDTPIASHEIKVNEKVIPYKYPVNFIIDDPCDDFIHTIWTALGTGDSIDSGTFKCDTTLGKYSSLQYYGNANGDANYSVGYATKEFSFKIKFDTAYPLFSAFSPDGSISAYAGVPLLINADNMTVRMGSDGFTFEDVNNSKRWPIRFAFSIGQFYEVKFKFMLPSYIHNAPVASYGMADIYIDNVYVGSGPIGQDATSQSHFHIHGQRSDKIFHIDDILYLSTSAYGIERLIFAALDYIGTTDYAKIKLIPFSPGWAKLEWTRPFGGSTERVCYVDYFHAYTRDVGEDRWRGGALSVFVSKYLAGDAPVITEFLSARLNFLVPNVSNIVSLSDSIQIMLANLISVIDEDIIHASDAFIGYELVDAIDIPGLIESIINISDWCDKEVYQPLFYSKCSSLSGWTVAPSGNGTATISPPGQFRLLNSPAAAINSIFISNLGSFSGVFSQFKVTMRIKMDLIGSLGVNQFISFRLGGVNTELLLFASDVVRVGKYFEGHRDYPYSIQQGVFHIVEAIVTTSEITSDGKATSSMIEVWVDGVYIGSGAAGTIDAPHRFSAQLRGDSSLLTEAHIDDIAIRKWGTLDEKPIFRNQNVLVSEYALMARV